MGELAQLLSVAIQGFAQYKVARDAAVAAGVVTNAAGVVKSDDELIALFKMDAKAMEDHANEVLAKYGGSANDKG